MFRTKDLYNTFQCLNTSGQDDLVITGSSLRFPSITVDSIRAMAAKPAAQYYAERQMTEQLGSGLWCAEKCTRNAPRSILGRYIHSPVGRVLRRPWAPRASTVGAKNIDVWIRQSLAGRYESVTSLTNPVRLGSVGVKVLAPPALALLYILWHPLNGSWSRKWAQGLKV